MITAKENFLKKWDVSNYSHKAMNTIFQIFIADEDKHYAEQAAFEAFNELDLLEELLSKFRPNSDISRINNLQPGDHTMVSEDTFRCLVKSIELFDLTDGIFDISLGEIIQNWKGNIKIENQNIQSQMPSLFLDAINFNVIVNDKINLDLGGIGKGYAAQKIEEVFSEWEIGNYLISCGNSTVKAKSEKNKIDWPITLTNPLTNNLIKEIKLTNGSISSSGLAKENHIINPRNMIPINSNRSSCWIHCYDNINSDALSTAFMIMEYDKIENICSEDKTLSCLILDNNEEGEIISFGDYFPLRSIQ